MAARRGEPAGVAEEKVIRIKELAKLLAGVLLALALLAWVLKDSSPRAIWHGILGASPAWLAASVVLNVGHNVFRVLRWRALLHPVRPGVPFRPMFAAVVIGYMTTWVIPGRLGELVRPLLLSAKERLPHGPTLGSVFADRMLDAATVAVLAAAGLWVTPLEGPALEYATQIRGIAILLCLGVFVGLGLMTVASVLGSTLVEKTASWPGPLRWGIRTAVSLSFGVRALRSPALVARLLVHSLLAWLVIAASTWTGIVAMGIDFPFTATLVILPMLVLGVAVPTPGGAGSYHAALTVGLTLFGVARDAAVGAAVVVHLVVVVPIVLLGMLLLKTEGVSFRELLASAKELRNLGSAEAVPVAGRAVENAP